MRAFSRMIHERLETLSILCAKLVRNAPHVGTFKGASVGILDVIFLLIFNCCFILDILFLITLSNEAIDGTIAMLGLNVLCGVVFNLSCVLLSNIVVLVNNRVLISRHDHIVVVIAAVLRNLLHEGLRWLHPTRTRQQRACL